MPAEAPPVRLRVAAVHDTTNPAWRSFYPEDLPADWRLAYYAHFWRDLLVLADDWTAWVEDPHRLPEVPAELRIYFNVPPGAGSDCAELASRLGARLGGFLLSEAGSVASPQLRPSLLSRRVPDPVIAGSRCAQAFANGRETVLVLEPETGLDLRQWRTLLEALHAVSTPEQETLVFLHAAPDEIERAQTILRLSGLAWRQD
jgi:hypothetical protein